MNSTIFINPLQFTTRHRGNPPFSDNVIKGKKERENSENILLEFKMGNRHRETVRQSRKFSSQ